MSNSVEICGLSTLPLKAIAMLLCVKLRQTKMQGAQIRAAETQLGGARRHSMQSNSRPGWALSVWLPNVPLESRDTPCDSKLARWKSYAGRYAMSLLFKSNCASSLGAQGILNLAQPVR